MILQDFTRFLCIISFHIFKMVVFLQFQVFHFRLTQENMALLDDISNREHQTVANVTQEAVQKYGERMKPLLE